MINTPTVADMLAKEQDVMKDVLKDQSIGPFGRPEEIASAIPWLAAPAQASWSVRRSSSMADTLHGQDKTERK